jgi:hypothetical protein
MRSSVRDATCASPRLTDAFGGRRSTACCLEGDDVSWAPLEENALLKKQLADEKKENAELRHKLTLAERRAAAGWEAAQRGYGLAAKLGAPRTT